MKTLILINGKKRHGKDYLCDLLIKLLSTKYGITAARVAFADPIKEIIADTFNVSLEELEDFKNNGDVLYEGNDKLEISFRTILQRFGTEAMKKQFGENVWADLGINSAIEIDKDVVIIPDFRFESEYNAAITKACKDGAFNIITVKIYNDDIVSTDTHASETELDSFNFDFKINNTAKPKLTHLTHGINAISQLCCTSDCI